MRGVDAIEEAVSWRSSGDGSGPNGGCIPLEGSRAYPLGVGATGSGREAEKALAHLRARPVLVAVLDRDQPLELLLPDPEAPARTVRASLP